MSIYATLWEIAVPIWVRGRPDPDDQCFSGVDQDGHDVHERFIKVRVQAVPAHIGHEGGQDYYATFLPPPVEYDENDWDRIWTPRAVFIIDEDHAEKDVQQYVEPLLAMTGAEYEAASFDDLLRQITDALEARFGAGAQRVSISR